MSSGTPFGSGASEHAELIEELSPRLLAWARLRLGKGAGRIDPEDLVQEIWCRALGKLAAGEAPADVQSGWVFQIAKFVLLEAMRKARYVGRVQGADGRSTILRAIDEVPAEVTTITRKVGRREALQKFLTAVEQMDETDQKVYLLCGLEDLPHADVAVQLGMEKATVTKRWQRLRAKLRAMQPPEGLLGTEQSG